MNPSARFLVTTGAINGFLAVAFGAFGAHGLKKIASNEQLAWFATGTEYHMAHALALLLCGVLAANTGQKVLKKIGLVFLVGILIFSGTLYAMALGAPRWFGAITPFGGTAFLVAWGWLFLVSFRHKE